ncbi:hypothetical protein LCGC14_1778800 [marine sediment metagenome]|uniref:Uncharacterized protein n=1 Tax=marine sediment metagenome TaxID=412755 RepID=A0A0F9AV02_9ZZZZ
MTTVGGSINIQQEEPKITENPKELDQVAIPLIGGDLGIEEIKANFNALLYLQTEQMAILLKLLDFMVAKELATAEEMNNEILAVTGDKNQLTGIYNEMFTRFVGYYSSLRKLMADGKIMQADVVMDTTPKGEQNV